MASFTLTDTLGILKACFTLLPLIIAPGYVAGWMLNLFEFRQRRPILRLILATPLTIAICPMLSYLLARFFPHGLWVFYGGATAACVLLLVNEARQAHLHSVSKHAWIGLALVVLWGIAAVGSLVDLQIGDKLYPPIIAYDHAVRTVMTNALARHIPPGNPFFANSGAPLRYHYLWLLFCSLPMRAFLLAPRYVVYSGVVWCGVALMCTIALGVKFLLHVRTGIEQTTLLAIGLLSVTGLDILPTFYIRFAGRVVLDDMELWNEPQITSWAGSLLWVPNHVAALIACFVAFLLLRHQADAGRWASAPVIVGGMAFASAAGMSVYVTFTFVLAFGLWLLALLTRRDWREATMFVAAGAAALLLVLPFILSLRGPGAGTAFAEVALRPFSLAVHFARRLGLNPHTPFDLTLLNLLFLPINYAFELGFFLAAAFLRLRQLLRGQIDATFNELASWTLVVSSFLIGTFLRSSTTGTNDLGWRCFLPAQLILLLWGATLIWDWWFQPSSAEPGASDQAPPGTASQAMPQLLPENRPRPRVRALVAMLLVLGLIGTVYQVSMLRVFPILLDRGVPLGESWADTDQQFGQRASAFRSAYEVLDAQLAASAILQSNPATEHSVLHMLYSGHDSAAATPTGDPECGTAFGGDPRLCTLRRQKLAELFEFPDGSNLDAICRAYGIDAIVVENHDPVWRQPASWIWTKTPLVANAYVRAFRCGAAAMGAHS